jgi:hypothetical protein
VKSDLATLEGRRCSSTHFKFVYDNMPKKKGCI